MDGKNERFWRSLRDATDATGTPSEREMREAEELLLEIDAEEATDAREPLSPEVVEHWVEHAVSSRHAPQLAPVPADTHEPERHRQARPWSTWLAAAAAFLVTPKFLVAAAVTAGVAVTTVLLQHTTTSLPFQEAIQILMDAEQPDAARAAAGGRVYFDVAESIMTLNSLADAPAGMASQAGEALAGLRQELEQPTPFAQASFSHSLTDLTTDLTMALAGARDGTATHEPQALQELAEQARYGIQAIREADTETMPAEVRANSRLHLIRIRQLLQR